MTPAMGYTQMKDSEFSWLGQVPKHWKVTRMKSIFQNVSIKNHPEEEVLSLYRDLGVVPKNSRDDNHNVTSEDTAQYKYVEAGNLVINKMKAWQGSLAVSAYTGIVSPAYYVCRFRSEDTDKRYIHYLLRCNAYAQEFERLSTGMRIGQWDLGIDDFLRVPVLLPDVNEQTAIAAYLDTQCAKIDEIIAEAKASIEEYKQWKASVIYEAVTKGLDPDVEMKESGVEWIKTTPAEWKVMRLKWLLADPLQYGANETGLPYDSTLPRYIRITDVTLDGKLKYSGMQSLSEEMAEGYILDDGDILLARSGATVGKAFYYRKEYGRAAFAGYMIRAKINRQIALPKFVYYSTMSAGYEKWKETTMTQATIQNIGASRYNEYVLPVPPLTEQTEIIQFLDNTVEMIDKLISEKDTLVSDLESYKKSLIYEVVTGKCRVPEEAETTVVAIHPAVLAYQKALLMCRVLDLLGDDTRGRIHVQKCLFAVECLLKMPFKTQYTRYEHGPYDSRITDYETLIGKNNWFTVQNGSPVTYQKGTQFDTYLTEYMKVFADMDSKIKDIVEFLKPMKTSQAERVATLLAVWNDFILDGNVTPTDQQIIAEVMMNWTPNKANTQVSTWQDTLNKLKQFGLVPNGFGLHTITKEAQEV